MIGLETGKNNKDYPKKTLHEQKICNTNHKEWMTVIVSQNKTYYQILRLIVM